MDAPMPRASFCQQYPLNMRTKIPRSSIVIPERFRQAYNGIEELAASIKAYGLIQPVILTQDNILVAGGRRMRACDFLGLQEIDVCYRETMDEEERLILEAEENFNREDFTWIEKIYLIEKVHAVHKKKSALSGNSWGQKQTAACFGMASAVSVNYSLELAKYLHAEEGKPKEEQPFHQCTSMMDAYRLRMKLEEDALMALNAQSTLSKRIDQRLEQPICYICNGISKHDETGAMIECPNCGLSGYEPKSDSSIEPNLLDDLIAPASPEQLDITSRLHHGDSIKYMLSHPNTFDHIITDPPYGIDMDMLNQGNDGHAFKDIGDVLAEHEVEPNKQLLAAFFPAAYSCLKDNSFCITWCDQMLWQFMYDTAISAGFKVQRWPITWVKTHRCMNQMAQTNFTKTTEIAMVCRKGVANMIEKGANSDISASHDEYKEQLGHPFVKPFAVWEHLIKSVSISGQLILEPFAGRGSGVISLIRLNRQFVACESNEQHFNALIENVKQHYLSINPKFTFI
jgi:DNA modification methylase